MLKLTDNLFRFFRYLRGRDLFIYPVKTKHTEKLGNKGADWVIYSNELSNSSIVYSLGIGTDISFDLELISKYNLNVFAFDPTPKSLEWLSGQILPEKFKYFPIGISDHDGSMEFFAPDNQNHTSFTIVEKVYHKNNDQKIKAEVKRISTIVNELKHTSIDILKMDIEGAEYDVIEDIIKSSIPIKQILIEFHHRFNNIGLAKTKNAIEKLKSAGYEIFSISKSGEEYSFIHSN